MKLRKAKLSDAKDLFEWRNDPDTRLNSVDTNELRWEDHLQWFKASLNNQDRFIFIANEDEAVIGTCRADREFEGQKEIYRLSWTISPDWRGKGMGKKMVAALLSQKILAGRNLKAIIREDNMASMKMASYFGFEKTGCNGVWTEWSKLNDVDVAKLN